MMNFTADPKECERRLHRIRDAAKSIGMTTDQEAILIAQEFGGKVMAPQAFADVTIDGFDILAHLFEPDSFDGLGDVSVEPPANDETPGPVE